MNIDDFNKQRAGGNARAAAKETTATEESEGDTITSSLNVIGKALGLREGFFTDLLLEDDDWTAVIKCHALLESVVCTAIASHVGKNELQDVLAEEVEMNSRIAFLKALNLASDEERRTMRALGNLRNKLVHNVRQTDFRFSEYLIDKGRRDQFVKDFGVGLPETVELGDKKMSKAEWVLGAPRLMIWISVLGFAAQTVTAKVRQEIEKQEKEAMRSLRRRLLIDELEKAGAKPDIG